jgi:hypothetical protein
MAKISEHFDTYEFRCTCGCGKGVPSTLLVSMLEQLFSYMGAKEIWISSGYRCDAATLAIPGAFLGDGHNCNVNGSIAADLCVIKQDGEKYTSWDIAEAAERIGFNGILLIDDYYCHLDTRGYEPYKNDHWFGNEMTGEGYETFERGTVFPGQDEYNPDEVNLITLEVELQTILKEKGYDINTDGVIGNITLSKLRDFTIEPGDSGKLTLWTQKKLKSLGYSVTLNGVADQQMMDAIHQFQSDNKLGVGKILSGGDWAVLASKKVKT